MSDNLTVPAAGQLQAVLDGEQSLLIHGEDRRFEWVDKVNKRVGRRIVTFGPQLDAQKLHEVLSQVIPQLSGQLSVYAHQPLPEMPIAVVVAGFEPNESLKPLLMTLSERLDIELTAVEAPPSLDKPGVLLMDMDSTAIQIECIDEIAALAGVGEQVVAVTRRAMQGELDFTESLYQRVATLAGADESILQTVVDEMPLMPGLETVVSYLKSKGWVVAIASGGFTYFTETLKQRLGLTATFANVLEIENGKLTGKVLGDVVDAEVKAQTVRRLAEEHGIEHSQTVAIGDGANDLKMLDKAALGVAFHAKPLVRQKAASAVNNGGLEQLLYLLA